MFVWGGGGGGGCACFKHDKSRKEFVDGSVGSKSAPS